MTKEKQNCYLCTIWHTGTKYFKKELDANFIVSYSHINKETLGKLKNYEKVFTTYRDPHRVAASWGNRGYFKKQHRERKYQEWQEQWGFYRDILKTNPLVLDFTKGNEQHGMIFSGIPVNTHPDNSKLHEGLDMDEKERLYRLIPKELIDFAIECSGELYKREG